MKEYTVFVTRGLSDLKEQLNLHAEQGYECKSAHLPIGTGAQVLVIMERERQDERNLREPA